MYRLGVHTHLRLVCLLEEFVITNTSLEVLVFLALKFALSEINATIPAFF